MRRPSPMLVKPVPPFAMATVPVTLDAVPPMLRVDVESAVTFPEAPVAFPRIELAAIWAILVRAMPLVARVRVEFDPPTSAPRVPVVVNSADGVKEVVATFAKVLALEKYGILLTTAAVEVERPPKERVGVEPPEDMIGQVAESEVTPVLVTVVTAPLVETEMPTPAATDEEAVHVGTPPSQPRTWPFVPPVSVRAEAEEPMTEIGWERERTPEAVREVVATDW
jgi:hypothetical protein